MQLFDVAGLQFDLTLRDGGLASRGKVVRAPTIPSSSLVDYAEIARSVRRDSCKMLAGAVALLLPDLRTFIRFDRRTPASLRVRNRL
jgi:hypothetical protein